MNDVFDELRRAKDKFPSWPDCPFHALAILQEEVGELSKAIVEYTYEPEKGVTRQDVASEAVQVCAMAIRFIEGMGDYSFVPNAKHEGKL